MEAKMWSAVTLTEPQTTPALMWRSSHLSAACARAQRVTVPEDAVRVEPVLEFLQPRHVLGPERRSHRGRAGVGHAEEVVEPARRLPGRQRLEHPGTRGLDDGSEARSRRP